MSALRENTLAALQAPGVEGDLERVGGRIRQHMKTFDELKAVLAKELLEIEQLAGIWPSTMEKRHVKEREIGQHCYEAEEDLSPLELNELKKALGINDTRWRAYKAKFIKGSSPGELA